MVYALNKIIIAAMPKVDALPKRRSYYKNTDSKYNLFKKASATRNHSINALMNGLLFSVIC